MKPVRTVLWLAVAAAVFLALAWPAVAGTDPANRAFELAAKTTLVVFLAALVATLVLRLRGKR